MVGRARTRATRDKAVKAKAEKIPRGNEWRQNSDWGQNNDWYNRPTNDWGDAKHPAGNNEGGQTSAKAESQETPAADKHPKKKRNSNLYDKGKRYIFG